MKRLILFLFVFCAFALMASAQTFTASATITVNRKNDGTNATQNKADNALREDIVRYVIYRSGAVVNPTEKDASGTCLPYTMTIGANGKAKTINVDVFNRDPGTCAVIIQGNGKPDIRSLSALSNILNRIFVTDFNFLTDVTFVQDAATVAATTASTTANNDPARAAEKVDPPQ